MDFYKAEWEYEEELYRLVVLDTSGLEACKSPRLRSAKVTEIALLIDAADDAPNPQIIESIENNLSLAPAHIVISHDITSVVLFISKIINFYLNLYSDL